MSEHGICPKHGRYRYSKIEGVAEPIKDCGRCALERLSAEAQAWVEGLPPEKKAVLVRRRQIHRLYQRKVMWSFYAGLGPGAFLGAGIYAYVTSDLRHVAIFTIGATLVNFGFAYMRNLVSKELIPLENEHRTWEAQQLKDP